MSSRYIGGIISNTVISTSGTPITGGASGIWTVTQQLKAQQLNQWPSALQPPINPTINTVSLGNGTAFITVNVTNNGGFPVTSYTVTASSGRSVTSTTQPLILTGLTNGTAYTFKASASNLLGTGNYGPDSSVYTPTSVPDAPTSVTGAFGYNQATVSFTAPNDNGLPITNYTVYTKPGFTATSGSASPITITGLTNGAQYTFMVVATNANGVGAASADTAVVVPGRVANAPTGISATFGDSSAAVAFTAPTDNGGIPISSYTVTSNPGGLTGTGTVSPVSISGLTNGTSYTFTVAAVNTAGAGASSVASNSVIPGRAPAAPTLGVITPGNGSVSAAFTPPSDIGGYAITGYTITSTPGSLTGTGTTSPITVSGLTNNTSYRFTITATNARGTSAASGASGTVYTGYIPAAPTIGTATRNGTSAAVSFTPPANANNTDITSYLVTSSPGNITATGLTSPVTITGLTLAQAYTFTVKATNPLGTGVASAASNSVAVTLPGAPTIGTATRDAGAASVAFTAPASNGNAAITRYTVTSTPGNFTGTGSTSPVTVSGLTLSQIYTFTVTATNAVGTGPASAASNSILAVTTPGAPTVTAVAAADTNILVYVNPPVANGGAAITKYNISSNTGGYTAESATSPVTFTNVTPPYTNYTFSATATNVVGTSVASTGVVPSEIGYVEPNIGDALWSYVALLLNSDIVPNATQPTDLSNYKRLLLSTGAVASIGANKWGTGSTYFNGSSYINIPASSTLRFSSTNFTVDCWVYITAHGISGTYILSNMVTGYPYIGIVGNKLVVGKMGSAPYLTGTSTVNLNTWTHIAVVRNNGTVQAFVDGATQGSVTDSTDYSLDTMMSIFSNMPGSANYTGTGYLDDFRITLGISRYSSTFTVPGRVGTKSTAGTGISWIANTPYGLNGFTSIVRGSDKYVVVQSSGSYWYSADGLTWTACTNVGAVAGTKLSYIGGVYRVLPYSGTVGGYSNDGITWNVMTLPNSYWAGEIAYNGSQYILVPKDSSHNTRYQLGAYSSNGITWSAMNMPYVGFWCTPAYGNGVWMSFDDYSGPNGAYSTNGGASWTSFSKYNTGNGAKSTWYYGGYFYTSDGARSGPTSPYSTGWTAGISPVPDPAIDNSQISNGYDYTLSNAGVKINNTFSVSTGLTNSANGWFLHYVNSWYILIPRSDVSGYYISTDGSRWIWRANNPGQSSLPLSLYNYDRNAYIITTTSLWNTTDNTKIIHAAGNGYVDMIVPDTSNTMTNNYWQHTLLPGTGSSTIPWVSYFKDKYLAVENASSKLIFSTNGYQWFNAGLPTANTYARCIYGNGVFVAADTSSYMANLYYSYDGVAWSPCIGVGTSSYGFTDLKYDATYGYFVATASYYNSHQFANISRDGITWKYIDNTYSGGSFNWVSIVNSVVCIGSAGYGVSYNFTGQADSLNTTMSGGYTFNSQAGGSMGLVAATTSTTQYYTSTNYGASWTARTLPMTGTVTFHSNNTNSVLMMYFASAQASFTSTDGTSWAWSASLPAGTWTIRSANGGFFGFGTVSSTNYLIRRNMSDWTQFTLPAGTWSGIAYDTANATYIITGAAGAVAKSTNLTSWTVISNYAMPTASTWYTVYGSTYGVAVGTGTATAGYSTDGLSWTSTTMPSNANWVGVAYGNNTFVAVGTSKTAYSTNGTTWTEVTMPSTTQYWQSIAFGNGVFVAVGNSDTFAYSADGITWNTSAITPTTNSTCISIAFGNGLFVVPCSYNNKLYISRDGVAWSTIAGPPNTVNVIAYGGGQFRVLYRGNSTYTAYSTDLVSWVSLSRNNPTWYTNAMACGPLGFVMFGYFRDNGVYYAVSDGPRIAAQRVTKGIVNATNNIAPVYGNGVYISPYIGTSNSTVVSSTDGYNWVASTLPSTQSWQKIVYGNNRFVIVSGTVLCYSTTGGASWATSNVAGGVGINTNMIYGGGYFATINAASTLMYTSADAITWASTSLPSGTWVGIAYGNSTWVIITNSTTCAYSRGTITAPTWTTRTLAATPSYIAFGNGRFVTITSGSTAVNYSTDGITWLTATLPQSQAWNKLIFGKNLFVASVSGSTVSLYSADGITWTASALPVSKNWTGLVTANDKFYLYDNTGVVAEGT